MAQEISYKHFPNVYVDLIGVDGNAFVLIGVVQKALRDAGYPVNAQQFVEEAFECQSYKDLLCHIATYVNVVYDED